MYSGGRTLADFSQNLKTLIFRFWEILRKGRQAPGRPPQRVKPPPRAWRRFLRFSQKLENPGFPNIRQRPPPAVHAGRRSSDAPGAFRARSGKQNAPRARGWSNWRAVVRFVSRFSREKLHGLLKRGGPHVQRGEDFGGFFPNPENPGFQVFGKTLPEGSGFGLGEHRVGCLGW